MGRQADVALTRHVRRREGVLFRHLEVDREGPLRARFEILQDRREEIILEPFLVIAVRRAQANATLVDCHALDGTQPQIAVRRLDHRFDRTDRFGPELKHPNHLSTAVRRKNTQ